MILFSHKYWILPLHWIGFCPQDGPVSIQEKFEYIMYGRLYDIKADGLSRSPPEVYVNASHVILLFVLLHFT